MYDKDFGFFDEVITDFEMLMNDQGYNFITNFSIDREIYYRRAAEIHGIKFQITDEAHTGSGKRLVGDKAFYVDSSVGDLSDFWNTFDSLKEGVNA